MNKIIEVITVLNKKGIRYDLIDENDQVRFTFDGFDNEYMVIDTDNEVYINNVWYIKEPQLTEYINRIKHGQYIEYMRTRIMDEKMLIDVNPSEGEIVNYHGEDSDLYYWRLCGNQWLSTRELTRADFDLQVRTFISRCNLPQISLDEIPRDDFKVEDRKKRDFLIELSHKL